MFARVFFVCFRVPYHLFHPAGVDIICVQHAVGAELKGQWAAEVEEHLKIHLFEDFRNAWDVSFCLRHHGN